MLEKWYPVINTEKCTNCGECVTLCNSGVLEVIGGKVIVKYPEDCVWECTKCGDKCPEGSIQYQISID